MAKVIGKKSAYVYTCVCRNCASIIEYVKAEEVYAGYTDEGTKVMVIPCPECTSYVRTND